MNLDTLAFSRSRSKYINEIQSVWNQTYSSTQTKHLFLVLAGESGTGKLATVEQWLTNYLGAETILFSNGAKMSNGYFAGFYELLLHIMKESEAKYPDIIHRHEQSLKRLFPFLSCSAYETPKDLTNTASQDERTRFYHHEYQEKLLHGIYEFFLEYCQTANQQFLLVIDNAHDLPLTVNTFLQILSRRQKLFNHLRVILLFDQPVDLELKDKSLVIHFEPMDTDEIMQWSKEHDQFPRLDQKKIDELLLLSKGNVGTLIALLGCAMTGLNLSTYLSAETYIDFYLNLKGEDYKYQLLKDYIDNHCVSDDPVHIRNYLTANEDLKSLLHQKQIEKLQENTGEQLFRLIHYVSLKTEIDQISALAPIAIKLQEIGVYNTWFDMFSKYFTKLNLRTLPDGDQPHNASFVRMAFILYSLGLAKVSIPYLELFYSHFPESLMIPMILYSQSMTYGRYQLPVNLEKAEHYALLNLEKIDTIFKDHPKYVYIKVFAENALAYIRARQGRYEDALQLCTTGLEKMVEIYGDRKYALHQSILIYNTGQVYELVGNFEKSYETYKEAIELDPYYGEYYNDLANLLQRYEYYEEALENYEKAIQLCPPYYEAHINRGNLYEKIGDFDKAERDYLRALELKPDAVLAYSGLGLLYLNTGRLHEALEMLNFAIYHNPKEAEAYNNRGLIFQEMGFAERAKQDFDIAINLNPKSSEAYNNRATLYFNEGEYQSSLNDLNQAITIMEDSDYLINRGMLYQQLGQLENALQEFNYVIEKYGESDEILSLIEEVKATLAS